MTYGGGAVSGQIAHAMEDAAKKAEQGLAQDFTKAYHSILKDTEQKTKQAAEHAADNEAKTVEDLGKSAEHGAAEPHEPHSGGGNPEPRPAPEREDSPCGRDQVRDPHDAGRGDDALCPGGEPVDMATGRMFIEQVDASLPGILPLRITRRFESGYQAGRWMGRRWVCTFDERLEIDDQGVVHIGADGRTQAYPHPEPGESVQASAGARRDLESEPGERGYMLTDRTTGLVSEFTVQPGGREALLTKVRNRTGDHYTLAYDNEGVPAGIRHSGGYELRVSVAEGRITEVVLVGGAPQGGDQSIVRYGYTDGHLSEVYNSSGLPLRFANDAWGRVTSWTDRNHSRYEYVYDALGRVVEEGGNEGHLHFTFRYGEPDPATGLRHNTETNALGHTTHYEVNARHQIAAITDALGNTTCYERDAYDRLLVETDPLDRSTRYEYDAFGDLVAIIRPDGERSTAIYDDVLGLPVVITDPGGATWQQSFDEAGRRVSLTDPLGAVTRYSYDVAGRLTAIVDALGHTTRITCNAAGLPVEVTDPNGAVRRYERDAFGRTVAVTDALGAVTRTNWTVEGYPASRLAPDGARESWTYDGEGNLLTHVDAFGAVTAFEYGPFETLVARIEPDGSRLTFTHDAQMQLVGVSDALGRTWSYTYDPAGRIAGECDFDDRTTTYERDAAGQLVARTDPLGQVTRYRHDLLGNTVHKDAAGRVTTFGYDRAGRLVQATNPDADVRRTLDALGNVLVENVNGRTIRLERDALGRRTRHSTPAGHLTQWAYDAAGHPMSLVTTGGDVRFSHDAAGREVARAVGDGIALNTSWDVRNRRTALTVRSTGRTVPTTLQHRGYRYREDGYLVAVDDGAAGTRSFSLDATGRVTNVHAAGWSESYAYDAAGNVIQAQWPAAKAGEAALGDHEHVGHRLVRAGRIRYEYDAAGRVTLRQLTRLSKKPDSWRYSWDAEGRLIAVTTPDGTDWRYLYDPFGRRVAKLRLDADGVGVAERVDFTWDGAVLAEQTTQADYLPGPHTVSWNYRGLQPVAQTETIAVRSVGGSDQEDVNRRFFAVVTDLVGTPTELVDAATEEVAWRASTSLWGNTTWPTASTTYTPLRFPGQYFDPESRLHYNVHRYYDPETARYASPDPLGLTPSPNPHVYVHNPHTWSDPLGLSAHQHDDPGEEWPLPEGHTSSPALMHDPYHPQVVDRRSGESQERYGPTIGERARALGYDRRIPSQKAPFDSHGQEVFFNGKNYITRDVDGHNVTNGWKMFSRRGQRVGTYDSDLNYLKE